MNVGFLLDLLIKITREKTKMTHPNVAIVQKMYDCFNQGDMNTIRNEVFASDLTWNLPGRHPLSGIKHGADEVIAFFGELARKGVKVDLITIGAIDDETVVEIHRGHGQSNGAVLDAINCTHYTIRNGKIVSVQVFIGDQHPVDLLFWNAYALKPIPERLAV